MIRRTRGLCLALVGMAGGFACGGPSLPNWGESGPQVSAELRQAGRVIRVPEDQPTIAGAMAIARAGDTVKLAPGEFHEILVLKTGVRVVGSPSTIDATGLDNGILAAADVTCCASVESLTVKNSSAQGILVEGAHGLRLSKVILEGCGVATSSAGMRTDDAEVTIEDSDIHGSGGAGLRAITSDITINRSRLTGNTAAGYRSDGSTSHLTGNVLSENGRGVVLAHGSTANLEQNELSNNRDTGLIVYAGDDLQDQVRCSVKSSGNVATANNQGLQVYNSDLTSENDRFDSNGDGVVAGQGASMSAKGLSASQNSRVGLIVRDAVEYLFCADPDCATTVLATGKTHFRGEDLTIDQNGQDGVEMLSGGAVDISRSKVNGNGSPVGSGIVVLSGIDYQLGDGVLRHVDIPGRLELSATSVDGNQGAGLLGVGDSQVSLRQVNVRRNGLVGARFSHGMTGDIADSHLEQNGGDGLFLHAGEDPADQVRSAFQLRRNIITANNATGLRIFNSDVSSDSDRIDQNDEGVDVSFGGHLAARKGSVSFNHNVGIRASDVNHGFLCATPDCSRRATGSAPAVMALDDMDLNGNVFSGCFVGPGGSMDMRHSRVRGNGTGGFGNGLLVDSIDDYVDPDDGTSHHVDLPGQATVRASLIEGNNGWGAVLFGSSLLDLGGADRGRNSLVGNNNGAVLNGSSPTRNVSALGDWWGSTTETEIAAQLTGGPVDFVPFLIEPPEGSVRYSAAADFPSTVNPNQSWSYGWATSPGAPLNLYLLHGQTYVSGEVGWFGPIPGAPWAPGFPLVTSEPLPQPRVLDMGPGPSLYTVVRWTAPRSGRYDVFGKFFGTGVTTIDAHVLKGSSALFDAAVNGSEQAHYFLTVSLSKGESIDFEVGPGPGGDHGGDPTGFTALVAPRD